MAPLSVDRALTDEERHPLIAPEGRRTLGWLLQHPRAPLWNHRCGDRLTREGLRRVRAFARSLAAPRLPCAPGTAPAWAERLARRCLAKVPFYRRRGGDPRRFAELPACSRADLAREPWAFVPDGQPLEDLIVYSTSGTTGHPLEVLSHPVVSSLYLPLLGAALATRGVPLESGPGRLAIALVCAQRATYTYASVSAYLGGAGFCKVNLDPAAWRDEADRAAFLDDTAPAIVSGDPVSLAALAALPLAHRPRAIVSTATALADGLRAALETRFGCPVLDLYSMNECRLIAVAAPGGHAVLAHDVHVEVLRPDGSPCAPGERGEVTLSSGRNPFLHLLRYRTGDHAALDVHGPRPLLLGLEGRRPVRFVGADGRAVNSVDVSVALRPFALARFTLHQGADRALALATAGAGPGEAVLRGALRVLFGELPLAIGRIDDAAAKVTQYTSDLEEHVG
jgi:phenylacetate-CoA ligase